jgi:hypothetical protein
MDGEGEKTLKQKKAVSYKAVTNYYLSPYKPLFMRDLTSATVEWE